MAFTITELNVVGGQSRRGSSGAFYHYDNSAGDTVTGAGYFTNAYSYLSVGDIISVLNYASGAPSAMVFYAVTASSSTAVTITSVLA